MEERTDLLPVPHIEPEGAEGHDKDSREGYQIAECCLTCNKFCFATGEPAGSSFRLCGINPAAYDWLGNTSCQHTDTANDRHAKCTGFRDIFSDKAEHGGPEIAYTDGKHDSCQVGSGACSNTEQVDTYCCNDRRGP